MYAFNIKPDTQVLSTNSMTNVFDNCKESISHRPPKTDDNDFNQETIKCISLLWYLYKLNLFYTITGI